ncbi:MAG: hypothetical protein ABEJ58_08830 [Halodesulfurarchaeum sp.]
MGLFSSTDDTTTDFGDIDTFDESLLPEPGPALEPYEVLTGSAHVRVHRTARDVFEERGVYDSTFGYNLATLNLDPRHPDAGFRYAVEEDSVLHAEFTPTTPFCPQSSVLTTAAHRAWNGCSDQHEFDRVVIHIAPMHQHSEEINARLGDLPHDGDGSEAET